jgi:large subunit ribosomal protein L9
MDVKVILKQDLENLGERGKVVDVKAGYARNYLIPQGLAYEASEGNLRRVEEERKASEERAKRDYLEARRRASKLSGLTLTFEARAGEGDDAKLFGSVTNADIADRANAQGTLDFELDRRQVVLEEPLKRLGVFSVPVRLHADVEVEIEVRVERGQE